MTKKTLVILSSDDEICFSVGNLSIKQIQKILKNEEEKFSEHQNEIIEA